MRAIVPLAMLVVIVSISAAGSAAVRSPVDAEAPALVEADPASSDCALTWTPEEILASRVYQDTLALLLEEPGFVDLQFDDQVPHRFVALFDAEARADLGDPVLPAMDAPFELVLETAVFRPLVQETGGLAPPLVPVGCSGRLSPGASMSAGGIGCTANFLFQGSNGRKYIGSAGHCYGVGRQVTIGGVYQAATVVWRMNGGVGSDFELLEIKPEHYDKIDPAMCHWGGPEAQGFGGSGGVLRHYGYGLGYGETQVTRPRSGFGTAGGSSSFTAVGTVISGDSGSAARQDDGDAHGIITHVNVGAVVVGHSAPYFYGTTIGRAMDRAEAALGIDLTLMTAPNA